MSNSWNNDVTYYWCDYPEAQLPTAAKNNFPSAKATYPSSKNTYSGARISSDNDDEETCLGSGSSNQGDEENSWSCSSEDDLQPATVGNTKLRLNGREILSLINPGAKSKSPVSAPAGTLHSAADVPQKPGRTKLSTGAALFVPGQTKTFLPSPSPNVFPNTALGQSNHIGHGFYPAGPKPQATFDIVWDGNEELRLAVEQAFATQPWGLSIAPGMCPTTGVIDVEISLRVPHCPVEPSVKVEACQKLEMALKAQGPRVEIQNVDVQGCQIDFKHFGVQKDHCCWEFLHHGVCPRGPTCHWPHILPMIYAVHISFNSGTSDCASDCKPLQFVPFQEGQANFVPSPPQNVMPLRIDGLPSRADNMDESFAETPEVTPRANVPMPNWYVLSFLVPPPQDPESNDLTTLPGASDSAEASVVESGQTLEISQSEPHKASWADMVDNEDGLPDGPLWSETAPEAPAVAVKEFPAENIQQCTSARKWRGKRQWGRKGAQ